MQSGLERVFEAVGRPTARFTAPMGRLALGFGVLGFFGLMMVITSLVGAQPANRAPGHRGPIEMFAVGLVLLAVSGGIAIFAFKQWRRKVFVCPGGVVVAHGVDCTVFKWGDFTARESAIQGSWNFIPVGTYRAMEIVSSDGRREVFTRNRIRRVGELIDLIQENINKTRSGGMDAQLQQVVSAWSRLSERSRREIYDRVSCETR